MKPSTIFVPLALATAVLPLTLGCSGGGNTPDLGYVEGTITMDGKPLPGATVMFKPDEGRPSGGETDDDGYYVLTYSSSAEGARTGKHTVTIRTYDEPMPFSSDPALKKGHPETVPAKYNARSTLKKTVEPGDQTIDFKLTSEGEIVLPPNSPPVKPQSGKTGA